MLGALSVFLGDGDAGRSGKSTIGWRIIPRARSTTFSFSIMSCGNRKTLLFLQIVFKESFEMVLSS
jgi:hypothetical protein